MALKLAIHSNFRVTSHAALPYISLMGMILRMVIFGLARRFLGLPGMALIGGLLYLYWKTNYGGW